MFFVFGLALLLRQGCPRGVEGEERPENLGVGDGAQGPSRLAKPDRQDVGFIDENTEGEESLQLDRVWEMI